MSKPADLASIAQEIIATNICPELASSATQLVPGDGNPDSEIVFIGEAPGRHEDEQGKPFIGAAGKFLDQLLASIELVRSEVYITNIVKYRPPENRDPTELEKAAFLPYLLREIEVISPLLIVTLGRHSMDYFLPNQQISRIHGTTQQVDGKVFLPVYHPAAALYNGGVRQLLLDDFAKIPPIIRRLRDAKRLHQ